MQLESDLEPSILTSKLSTLDREISYIKSEMASLSDKLRWKYAERNRLMCKLEYK